MISQRAELPIVAFSVRVYQTLLLAYPTKFQQEYGSQMMQVFQDCCLRALRQGGTNGMVRLWAVTLIDFVQSVISEHRRKEFQMKNEDKVALTLLGGWALMIGAIAFWSFFPLEYVAPYSERQFAANNLERNLNLLAGYGYMLAFGVSPLLLLVGLMGLRARYGDIVGNFGKNILLVGAFTGPIVAYSATIVGENVAWILFFAGSAVSFACLALFGIVALNKKPLPRWNVLPLIAGFWYPTMLFTALLSMMITGDLPEDSLSFAHVSMITLQCVALFMLGYILKSDVPEETAAPA